MIHAAKLKQMLSDVAMYAREEVGKVSGPKAQALFETTAEVLMDWKPRNTDFEEKKEPAWKGAAAR
jgi:hypothetical protein